MTDKHDQFSLCVKHNTQTSHTNIKITFSKKKHIYQYLKNT